MKTVQVPLVVTTEDRKRQKYVIIAEAKARGIKTPDFMIDGLGLCAKVGDPDDFTNTETRYAGAVAARERAKAICRTCPFAEECLQRGLDTNETGVYGGEYLIKGRRSVKG